jgi:hypothetical protein
MKDLIPTNIDGVIINVVEKRREIRLPLTMSGEQFARWKKGKGGMFYNDLSLWLLEKDHGNYISMEYGDENLIVRLIEDHELDEFSARRLIHGKIKDKSYMILLNLSGNEELDGKNGYIEESTDEDLISEISMNINQPNIPQDDDEAGSAKSISLFED